ncbi:MAG: WYL domain-containing protein [Collinsella sp.]|nr:WYL domain-containing protein [Collinsella sp.]
MSRTFSEEEISKLKESGFAVSGTSRSRILSVLDLLVRFTDEKTGISASEIARIIGICSEKPTSENAILKDLHQISESMPMGIRVAIPSHGENIGFRAINKPLSSEEAILISDVVGTSSFIGEAQKEAISSKVLVFSSDYDVDESIETVFVDRKAGKDTDMFFGVLHAVSRAIRMNEKVAFKKQVHLMSGPTVKVGFYEEDPVAIVFSFGRYYLESMHLDESGFPIPHFHRLDDITDLVITGKPLSDQKKVEALRARVITDTRQRIDMFGTGATRMLFLEVSGSHAKYVYEKFGHDLKFCHIDENSDNNVIGYVCVNVILSPTFFRWLFGMNGAVRLTKPKGKRWVDSFPNAIASGFESYIQDYKSASEGYKAALEAAILQLGPKSNQRRDRSD